MLAFIHIPKTAGSSVNSSLAAALGFGLSHVEAHIDKSDFEKVISNCNWISGHVTRSKFADKLKNVRKVNYITFMRSPIEQLISHVKWQFAIFDKGREFFLSHPMINQIIALETMNVNYDKPSEVIDLLRKYNGLFLNYQSRFIANGINNNLCTEVLEEICSFFSLIGTTENLYPLLSGYLGTEIPEVKENENKQTYFNEDVFTDNEVESFINEHNSLDIQIYKFVKDEIDPLILEKNK